MRVLVLGGTGLLGAELVRTLRGRNIVPVTLARKNADIEFDLSRVDDVPQMLAHTRPDAIINAAAKVDVGACEADPAMAYLLHANLVTPLMQWSKAMAKPLIHISTDQYFDGDGEAAHAENAPVKLFNVYAASKHAGEMIALCAPQALVIRTNFTGLGASTGKLQFARWAMESLTEHKPLQLFDDYYCSTMDTGSLARAICDLLAKGATGLLNVASSEISSKTEFIHELGNAMGINPDWAIRTSASGLTPRRPLSLGLDVRKAEKLLGYELPDLAAVTKALVREWRET